WHLLRPSAALVEPTWFLGGAVWLLGVGGIGALVHRHPREVWHDCALIGLGLVVLTAAQMGPEGEEIGWALTWRGAALGLLALGLGEVTPGLPGRWRAVLFLVGIAALVGLPPWPTFGLWREVLGSSGALALPGWVVGVAAGALGASALGWWRALHGLLTGDHA
ncbi:MAG: hypothetical protein ACP5UM_08115, partial [Anaerolineae bacterium]